MRISVVLPVYNGEQYIARCLDSLKSQNIQDMEVIIVDDGSTDDTYAVADSYREKNSDMNIRIIRKENAGLPQARKTGVENAQGDYIGFIDVDDWMEPEMYSKLLDKAEKEEADVVCCGYVMDFVNKSTAVLQKLSSEKIYEGSEAIYYLHERTAIYPYAWNKIYRRDILRAIRYPHGNFVGEDYAIMVQILNLAKRVCVIPEAMYHYAQVEDSMCRGGYNENYIIAFDRYENTRQELVCTYPEYKDAIDNYIVTEYMAMIVAMGKNKNYNQEMIHKIQKFVRVRLFSFMRSKNVSIVMKGSAVAVSVNYRLLILIYNLTAKVIHQYIS